MRMNSESQKKPNEPNNDLLHKYLRDFHLEELEKKNQQIQKTKEKFNAEKNAIVKKVKNILKCKNVDLTRAAYPLRNFKFTFERLEENDTDYELLKEAIKDEPNEKKIVRVVPTRKRKLDDSDANSSSLLLLHATDGKNVMGILKEDFIPSK